MSAQFLREIEPMCRAVRFLQTIVFCAAVLMVASICVHDLQAQDAPPIPPPSAGHHGIPQDWSNRHVIYTRNGSFEDMVKVRDDPRFINSFLRYNKNSGIHQSAQSSRAGLSDIGSEYDPLTSGRNKHSKVDWAVSLGSTSGMALGESPAKYTLDPYQPPSCSDFVVYTIDAAPGVHTQANLIGLYNLYTGGSTIANGYCLGIAPKFLFSYAIGTGASELSPVLSLDGTKVAWLENRVVAGSPTTDHAFLHVTTFVAGQGTDATTGAVAVGSGGSSDIAIDYTNLTLSACSASPSFNTDSDLYVDYGSDSGYVSADNGILYHISGIFLGTPTVDFCIPVNTSTTGLMSGTVYDEMTGQVFVSDSETLYAYNVGPTAFTPAGSYLYAENGEIAGPGPMLDAFHGYIYVFNADTMDNTAMTQLPVSLASAVVVPLGPPTTYSYPVLFYGAFDNNYLTNGPANSASTLYTCGTDSTNNFAQALFAVSFDPASGQANTTPAMADNENVNPGDGNGVCSPIEEFYDGTTDRIFVGMGDFTNTTTGGASIVTMWNVTNQLTSASDIPTASATPYLGGTSGIVVDNNANPTTYPQAESIYFSTLLGNSSTTTCGANNYCAVKLTQSVLK
jgi:hypothetical protein